MSEHNKAKRWRESHNLTPDQLGEAIGYSGLSIYWYERGCTPPRPPSADKSGKRGKPKHGTIDPWVWKRYKMACAGYAAQLKSNKGFDW